MTVVLQIEKNHTIVDTRLIKLNNCVETIKIPINIKDVGGFAIKWHFVNYNEFNSGNLIVNVPHQKENTINITTNIFRDKLQPGTKETWSFTINNDKNDAIAAEVLASMYDASLDEFKSHNWQFNPTTPKPNYYSYTTSNANKSFENIYFNIRNNQRRYYSFPTIAKDTYNWFGFGLNNNWENQQYLRAIKRKINSSRTEFDGTIIGFIADENGEPLPGVSILIKGTTFGTETDFDGNYTINIKKDDVLIITYLGYTTQEIKIGNKTVLDIKLKESANSLDEVVVTAMAINRAKRETVYQSKSLEGSLNGKVAGLNTKNSKIILRGTKSLTSGNNTLIIIDGIISSQDQFDKLNPKNINNLNVLKGANATALYGSKGANGVILITTKNGQSKLDNALSKVQARKNFKETAFFFPQLKTDIEGKVSFSFTMPEALTRWKLQLLAHTTGLKSAKKTLQTVTQKELMVVPNAPRFLREKDTITLSAKITNLTNNQLSGFAKLILTDAISGKEINTELQNTISNKKFIVNKDENTNVSWTL